MKRSPRFLEHMFCDLDGLGEIFSEPEAVVFVVVGVLVVAAVLLVLGGAVAVLQEAVFGGGPPQGLGLK